MDTAACKCSNNRLLLLRSRSIWSFTIAQYTEACEFAGHGFVQVAKLKEGQDWLERQVNASEVAAAMPMAMRVPVRHQSL